MKNVILALSIALLLLVGCDDGARNPLFEDIPVVKAYLKAGQPLSVTVSRQDPFDPDAVVSDVDIDALSIRITYADTSILLQSVGAGVYEGPASLPVLPGVSYYLAFEFNGKTVTAETTIPAKPEGFAISDSILEVERMDSMSFGPPGDQPDPIKVGWVNDDQSYYLVLVENIESVSDPITDFGDNAPPDFAFRKQPAQNDSSMLNSREFSYYGTHRIILFHLNVEYATLYDDASTSSQNLQNPSTSVVNAYGIFTGMNTDTLYLEVVEP